MREDHATQLFFCYKDKVPAEQTGYLHQLLHQADEAAYGPLSAANLHEPVLILVLSIFLGALGVDRFVLGDIGMGVCKLLFGWMTFGIWPLVDIYFSYRRAKTKNLNTLYEIASYRPGQYYPPQY